MIQSMTIMAFVNDGRTDEIADRLGVEPDHDDDPGTTIYGSAECCECGQMSWYHVDTSPIDVRDLIVHAACCDDDTTFVQAYKDMSGGYITEGQINGKAAEMVVDLDGWRKSL